MSYSKTQVRTLNLTDEDFVAAGEKAARKYKDSWFACDVRGKVKEKGTVIVKHSGIEFEVWLERTWRAAV